MRLPAGSHSSRSSLSEYISADSGAGPTFNAVTPPAGTPKTLGLAAVMALLGGKSLIELGLIPVVQAVVPSYQQFIAGSIVSQTIRVFDVPSVQAFIVQSRSRHDHSVWSFVPCGNVGRRGNVRFHPYCMQGKCVADRAT